MLARKQVVETLQVNRSASVKLLTSWCASAGWRLPEAVKQNGQKNQSDRLAQSNAQGFHH